MKRISILIATALTLAACQKNETPSPSDGTPTLYATIEDVALTKTYMDAANNIRWSEGDQVAAFMKTSLGLRYEVAPSSVGKTSAHFDEVGGSGGGLNAGTELSHNVVYYPYPGVVEVAKSGSNYAMNAVLPSEQTYTVGSFGSGSMAMVAVSDNTNITFRNVCGAMKLQLKGTQKVASIKLQGNNNEKLSGSATITVYTNGAEPAISMASGASTSVTLDCGKGVQLKESTATDFIISLPPVLFSKGFKVIVADTDGKTYKVETDKANTVYRSTLLVMPALVLEGESEVDQQVGDYIDEYGINHGKGVEIDGVIWAPVNCGYHKTDFKYGKLYQWGRKYGQGYDNADVTFPEIVKGPVSLSIGQSKDNEDKFFYSPNPYDWCEIKNDYLWNSATESNPVKTEYDPCPYGWRVPTHKELNALYQNRSTWICEDGQTGYRFSGKSPYSDIVPQVFLVSAGYRYDYAGGEAKRRGENGAYWSSRKGDDHGDGLSWARLLSFSSDHVYMADGSRANAYSVRCVRE